MSDFLQTVRERVVIYDGATDLPGFAPIKIETNKPVRERND
jgi:hypothetical protein